MAEEQNEKCTAEMGEQAETEQNTECGAEDQAQDTGAKEPAAAEVIEKLTSERDTRREALEEGSQDAVRIFLPVLDNLERALIAAGDDDTPLKAGVEMVLRQMNEALGQLKVECIDPLGEPFDAAQMNAVLQGTEDEGEPGSVCQVLQKGYRMGNKIIRHAMVKVVAG